MYIADSFNSIPNEKYLKLSQYVNKNPQILINNRYSDKAKPDQYIAFWVRVKASRKDNNPTQAILFTIAQRIFIFKLTSDM